jgi:hypothetical protein
VTAGTFVFNRGEISLSNFRGPGGLYHLFCRVLSHRQEPGLTLAIKGSVSSGRFIRCGVFK